MSNALLILAIGPVQQFIGQARRMRDLWFGSHLLSELSRAVAWSLADDGWNLVFPALDQGDAELLPCDGTNRKETGQPPLAIANRILASRPDSDSADAERAAVAARAAAVARWRCLAAMARDNAGGLVAENLAEQEEPEAVIESFLECYAAWSVYVGEGDFTRAREHAEQALAARKRLRNFSWWEGRNTRKSSLDGQRETILFDRMDGEKRPRAEFAQARDLRLGAREQLDGIALVKRAGGEPQPFVPIARVAIEPWLDAIDHAKRTDDALNDAFAKLDRACGRMRIPRTGRGLTRWLDGAFPYDAEIFLEGQWPALTKELGLTPSNGDRPFFREFVQPLFQRPVSLPEPYPYIACLRADGDHMGSILAALSTRKAQRKLSEQLAHFACAVRDIVEAHSGLHIYAGGDDVLAFLPLVNAIDCAEELRARFIRDLALTGSVKPATLSVGIGIAHCLTPLGRLLRLGSEAEKFAKRGSRLRDGDERQRNALGVIVDKRAGVPQRWRRQWLQNSPSPGERVGELRDLLLRRKMPAKLPYELRPIAQELASITREDTATIRTWRNEVARIVARKRPDASTQETLTPQAINLGLPDGESPSLRELRSSLEDWIGAAMIAHTLADAQQNIDKITGRTRAGENRDER